MLGTGRVLLLASAPGEVTAVLLEVPVMLSRSLLVARWLIRAWPGLAGARPRRAMGAAAPGFLLAAETVLAVWDLGQSITDWQSGLRGPPGLPGRAGPVVFGPIPLIRHIAGRR